MKKNLLTTPLRSVFLLIATVFLVAFSTNQNWLSPQNQFNRAKVGAGFPSPKAAKRPNIVPIMANDMGYSDLGCYGSEIPTPNPTSWRIRASGLRSFTTRPAAVPPARH